nr:hypothetical protein CFP56_48794 [Quercus suber]
MFLGKMSAKSLMLRFSISVVDKKSNSLIDLRLSGGVPRQISAFADRLRQATVLTIHQKLIDGRKRGRCPGGKALSRGNENPRTSKILTKSIDSLPQYRGSQSSGSGSVCCAYPSMVPSVGRPLKPMQSPDGPMS